MILTGKKIISEITAGCIEISPFDMSMVNPNSYNYRLGTVIYELNEQILDAKTQSGYKEIILSNEGFVLMPNRIYLGSTFETIGSSKYAITLIGRSSVGRLGLFLQISAPLGHVGTKHKWTLELCVVQPLKVYPKMRIGQVSFWDICGNNELSYFSEYWNYSMPERSKFFKHDINWE